MCSDDDKDRYLFNPDHLKATDEAVRCSAVMAASRLGLLVHEDTLLEIAEKDSEVSIRRHAIRGLGKMRSRGSVALLLRVLDEETGLIVGDAIMALGQIGASEAVSQIERHKHASEPWTTQQVRRALKLLARGDC